MKKIIIIFMLVLSLGAFHNMQLFVSDFSNEVDIGKFHSELQPILSNFIGISRTGNDIIIHFSIDPTSSETNTFWSYVSNHTTNNVAFSTVQDFTKERTIREEIVSSTKKNIVMYLLMTGVASNFDHAKQIGKPFMRQYIVEIAGYEQLDYEPLVLAISNNTSNLWLTNVVTQLGTDTIKQLIIDELEDFQ